MADYFINLWLDARHEIWALQEHVKQLEAMWLRAEADADHWYFEANNPAEARERHHALRDTTFIDVREARRTASERPAAGIVATRKAS